MLLTTKAMCFDCAPGASAGGDVSRAGHVPDGGVRHEEDEESLAHSVAVLSPDRCLHRLPVGRAAGF